MAKINFSKKEKKKTLLNDTWKILIVDDEIAVHEITKTVLGHFELDGKKAELLNAYSGKEALEIMQTTPDIAVILLDVVMETENAGLIVAQKIREELNNNIVRIILRTGQPGSAPEQEVIVKYRINDYKEKTELTSKKLFSSIVTAIRSYQDLIIIQKSRDGLEKIIDSTKSINEERSLELFAKGVLTQLISILNLNNTSLILNTNSALSIEQREKSYTILAGTGEYENIKHFEEINQKVRTLILDAIEKETTQFDDSSYLGYFKFNDNIKYLIYITGCENINILDKQLTEIFSNNIAVAFNNISLTKEIIDTQKEVIERLGEVVEKRSKEASKHVHRVAKFSYHLALDYGLSQKEAQLLQMASPMHDVGKIGIPDAILLKPGKLDEAEFKIMKKHASIGYKILKSSKREIFKAAATIAYEHHEKFDGSGYPLKKRGEDIHIYGRITAVADVFDALSHKRCYKEPWKLEDILTLMRDQRGKHFDPKLVDIVLKNIDKYSDIIAFVKDYTSLNSFK